MDDPRRTEGRHAICCLILKWQSSANTRDLEMLLDAAHGLMKRTARAALCRQGITDPSAIDDTVSLVLNHLRRIPGGSPRERPVARFDPACAAGDIDEGEAYLVWLTTERARDVARARRRRDHLIQPFSDIDDAASPIRRRSAPVATIDHDGDEEERVCEALHKLEPRLAAVVTMLLEGLPQTTIAARLRVCEGTVSRLRGRAIARLRELLVRR